MDESTKAESPLLVVPMQRCVILSLESSDQLVLQADLRIDAGCHRNDVAVAPNGNAYVGSTGRNSFTGDTLMRPEKVADRKIKRPFLGHR